MRRFIVSIVLSGDYVFPLAPLEAMSATHAFTTLGFSVTQARQFLKESDSATQDFGRKGWYSDRMPPGPLEKYGKVAHVQITEELPLIRNLADFVAIALPALERDD